MDDQRAAEAEEEVMEHEDYKKPRVTNEVLATQFDALKSDFESFSKSITRQLESFTVNFSRSLEKINDSLNNRRPSLVLVIGVIVSILALLVTGAPLVYWISSTASVSLTNPLSDRTQKLEIAEAFDSGKVTELESENQRVSDRLYDLEVSYQKSTAQTGEKFAEIETQFRADDQIRNTDRAQQERFNATVWEPVFKTRYPIGGEYYPEVGQHDSNQER
jgi:hypothetical protein